jgi:hypothetical protein
MNEDELDINCKKEANDCDDKTGKYKHFLVYSDGKL